MIGKPLPTAANMDDVEPTKQEKDASLKEEIERKKLEHLEAGYEILRKFNGVFYVHITEKEPEPKIYSKSSLFCLSDTNRVRYGFVWLATWVGFDAAIIVAIILNSFLLASTDYEIRLNKDH